MLTTAYRSYTTDVELDSATAFGATAPASTPLVPELVIILTRATMITAESSQGCAIAAAGGITGIGNTIKRVC